jgi:hypothetical protein
MIMREDEQGKQRIAANFYKELWSKRDINEQKRNEMIEMIKKKLSEESKMSCDKMISEEEISKAKSKMKKRTAGGVDGIPIEFWQDLDFLNGWLAELFNECFQKGYMSETMKIATVKLLYKKGGREKIGNYRPISLLCSDYKILAKIMTSRMQNVMKEIIENDQQDFIKDREITGNLILVKEVIEYCNKSGEEGAIILMDFQKAYDRVNRETMMKVLEKMNFGPVFLRYIRTMYKDVGASVDVNGRLSEKFITGGGVRQGCPLSPYLFICVLELMANRIRQAEEIKGIVEPRENKRNVLSLFADDSALMVGSVEEIGMGRRVMKDYEQATASKLHEGKTMVMRLGKMREKQIEQKLKAMEVEFSLMKSEDSENYLGDVIGGEVKEEERFEGKIEEMKKLGKKWKALNIGYYGRVIVANTLMLPKVLFRTQVNPVSESLRKKIHEVMRNFMWNKNRGVAWAKMLMPVAEGGLGLRDPAIVFDVQLVRIIKLMIKEPNQPWVGWLMRKKQNRAESWGCEGDLFGYKPNRTKVKELNGNCLFESMLKVWYELGGTTMHSHYLAKFAKKGKKGKEVMKVMFQLMRDQLGEDELGFEKEGGWYALLTMSSKELYWRLWEKRKNKPKYKVVDNYTCNQAMDNKKELTPKERDYWFKMAHGQVSTKHRESRWRREEEEGELMGSECPICKREVETKEHYNYDCKVMQKFITLLEEVYEEERGEKEKGWSRPSREVWNLSKKREISKTMISLIAKARWVYHKERGKKDNKASRRMDLVVLVDRVRVAMTKRRKD